MIATQGVTFASAVLIPLTVWIVIDVKRIHRNGILRLDRDGVHLRGVGVIPWSDIASVRQSAYFEDRPPSWKYGLIGRAAGPVASSTTAGRVLELTLRDKEAFLRSLSPWHRYVAKTSVLLRTDEGLKVDLTLADADPEEVAQRIREGVERFASKDAA